MRERVEARSKKSGNRFPTVIIASIFFVGFFFSFTSDAFAANRYWVGGGSSANWNATGPTNWGSASNTQDNASVPGASDDVFFDGVGTGASNSTLSSSITIKSLDMTGYANTLTHNFLATLTIAGSGVNFKLSSGMTYSINTSQATFSPITFTGTSGTTLITTAGKTLGAITFNGSGGTFQLQDEASTTGNFTRTNGTFDPNGHTLALTGIAGGMITGSTTFYNLSVVSGATDATLSLASDITVTNNLTLTGSASINRLFVKSNTLGTPRTITNTGATMLLANVDFRDITLTASYDCSAIIGLCGDAGGNNNFTFTPAQANYWVSGTQTWNDTSKWKLSDHTTPGRMPLPQDDVYFDSNSFTAPGQTVTANKPRLGKNIYWIGVTNTPTWAKTYNNGSENYGSITLVSGMNNTGTVAFTMAGRGSYTFTSAGQVWSNPLTIATIGGTVTLQDAFNSSATTTLTNGTFNANTSDVTAPAFSITGTNTRVLQMGSGTWTATSSGGTVWDATATTNLTLTPGNSTIAVSDTGASTKTFIGGGLTYNNATFSGDNITVTGSNTFNALAVNTAGLTNGLRLTSGTTQTVSSFSTDGSVGNLAKLISTSAGSAATLSKSSGTVTVDYMSIKDSTASGGATWYAGANSTSVSGNTGWLFSSPSSAPTVTTGAPTSVASSSMILNATIDVDGSASSTVRGFAYGTSATLATVIATTTENGTFGVSSFSTTTSGLTPNTVYYFRAYATGTGGTGYGSIVSTTTLPWSVPDSPTSVSVVPGNQQATITFTPGSTGGSPILYYYASSTPGNIASTSTGSPITVIGLTNGTSYTFQVYAVSAIGTSSPSIASSAVTPSNIVLDMNFDNDSPPTVVDDSVFGNNGTINEATATTSCQSGGCYSFDGVNDSISVTSSASLSPTSAITMSAWVKPTGKGVTASDYLDVIKKNSSYLFSIREDGTVLMYLTGVNSWVTHTTAEKNLFDGVWHNIVVTWDGSIQSFYVDGLFMASTTATGSITSNSNSVAIGGSSAYYKGNLDNVRIYNSSVSESGAQALYLSYGEVRTTPRSYYLSYSTGDDSNDGLSSVTPWKTFDMVYRQRNMPYGIIPGDSILLKRGDTWEGQITLDRIGTASSATTTIGAYGSGAKPIIYGDGRNLTWTAVDGYPGVYEANIGLGSDILGEAGSVYENNTKYTRNNNVYALTSGEFGILPYGRSDLIWIATSTYDGNPPSNIRVFRDPNIKLYYSSNILIENLDIRETNMAIHADHGNFINSRGIDTQNTQNISILYIYTTNSIIEEGNFDTSGCTTIYFAYYGVDNTMRNNVVSGSRNPVSGINILPGSCDMQAIGLHTGTRDIIEHNTIEASMDFYYTVGTIIRYNKIVPFASDAGIWPHGTDIVVYGNVGGVISGAVNTGTTPMKIFHNTVVGYVSIGPGGQIGESTGEIQFKNNIVYNDRANSVIANVGTVVDSDYNCFFNTVSGSNRFRYPGPTGTLYTGLAAYQTGSGKDANSVYADPQMNLTTYELASDSPCKDIGTDISGEIDFPYLDYAGVSIPQGSAPDAGGLEYVTAGAPTAPTVTTSAAFSITTTASTLNGTISATGGADAIEHGFAWGTSVTLATAATTTLGSKSGIGAFTSDLTGLTCATAYYARAYATNSAGTSYGSIVSFVTDTCPVTPDPTPSSSTSGSHSSSGSTRFILVLLPDGTYAFTAPGMALPVQAPVTTTVVTTPVTTPYTPPGTPDLDTLPTTIPTSLDLSEVPTEILTLAGKFPNLMKIIENLVSNGGDILAKLKLARPTLPTLTHGIPLKSLTTKDKNSLPSEVVFAKSGDLIEHTVSLEVIPEGTAEQVMHTVAGKKIDLAVKPEFPVSDIKGYLMVKKLERQQAQAIPASSLVAAPIAAFLTTSHKEAVVPETKLVLNSFTYTDSDKDGIYTATIDAPLVHGEYDIMTVITYKDIKFGSRELHLIVVVDPEGYVYRKSGNDETRIGDTKISLLQKDEKTGKFSVWYAEKYQQTNPQKTDKTGSYSFLVPEGTYKLTVTAEGYYDYAGEEFVVIQGGGVHENIELVKRSWLKSLWRWVANLF